MNQLSAGGGAYTSNLIWDARHRLTEADDPNNSNAATFVYEYDALNRRIHKKTWDNSGDVAMDVRILNDGWQPVQELNSSLTPTANLLTGLGLDEIFRRTTTSANTANPSATTDYLTDALHSTLALTNASGTIQTTYSYEPYGNTSVYGTASDNTYQYTGRENDGNGLYYYRNRFLIPGVGAFAEEDPIGFAAGQNEYSYVRGAPTRYIDPLGLYCLSPDQIAAIAGGIGGGVGGAITGAIMGSEAGVAGAIAGAVGGGVSGAGAGFGAGAAAGTVGGAASGAVAGAPGGVVGMAAGAVGGEATSAMGGGVTGGAIGGALGGIGGDGAGYVGGIIGGVVGGVAEQILKNNNDCGCNK
jgi:RHS repeat-associated protein